MSREMKIQEDITNNQHRLTQHLIKENNRYREALEFYAERGHYIASGYPNTELQAIEYGEKARKALESGPHA